MIIFVCGPIGVGKTMLAKAISEKLGIFYYDVDAIKRRFIRPEDVGVLKHPLSDATRTRMHSIVAQDLVSLSRVHRHVIVDDTLHRKAPREVLFQTAERLGGYIIVLIRVDEGIISDRIQARENHLLTEHNQSDMRAAVLSEAEWPENPDIVFENVLPLSESIDTLVSHIKEKIVATERDAARN